MNITKKVSHMKGILTIQIEGFLRNDLLTFAKLIIFEYGILEIL